MSKTVLLIGTLDTKGAEYGYVKDLIVKEGHRALLVNAGIAGEPAITPDINADDVAKAGGSTLVKLRQQANRGAAIEEMANGAARLTAQLYAQDKINGVLGLGGSVGTAIIATRAMQELPVGFPKMMISTLVSGNTQPYVGIKDVTMMHSVVDIAGLNRISRRVLANGARAIMGMIDADELDDDVKPPLCLE